MLETDNLFFKNSLISTFSGTAIDAACILLRAGFSIDD
jgi:hypothetical protein